jgi:glycosyltransferase involved in cell wall biosynthesis
VSDAELKELFGKAAIVAVPYREVFRRHGGASGVLLQALAQGKPLLATDAVADQLPAEYDGAVVVPAGNPLALVDGLEHALRTLSKLTYAAMANGPRFVEQRHTFNGYARALLTGSANHG